jgi:hypothetical protein
LPNPTQDILKKVNELIFTFIWSSPVHRVKKELLQKDFCEGGLKMINLNLFIGSEERFYLQNSLIIINIYNFIQINIKINTQ